jgi:predicted nucleic acid-binding protein
VSYLDRSDKDHTWVKTLWAEIQPPFFTCEPVISDACFFLRSDPSDKTAVMELLRRGIIVVEFHLKEDLETVARLMKKYANVPMSLADACLVRMAETIPGSSVLTLDRDFRIYRKSNRTVIPTIMPEA